MQEMTEGILKVIQIHIIVDIRKERPYLALCTESILLGHPLTTKTETYFVFPYSVLVCGLNYVVFY